MSVGDLPRELGRYVLYDQIASGGMATVHFARMHGAIGFSRLVAIKRVHPNYVDDAEFVQMFLDEARLAARLDHPNVVSTIDVVADDTEVFLVMEYVLGESLQALMSRGGHPSVPLPVASAIVCGVLEGLHSAHEACGDDGEPLHLVHRDVSPQNILVGVDGVARVFDFGIAKAATNTQETREGVIKGKVAYMAPEQVRGIPDRRADLYAVGVILWELIAGRRRHAGERNDTLFLKLARNELEPLPCLATLRDVPIAVDDIVARATDPEVELRFDTAREMAVALEAAIPPAPAREVGEWIRTVAATRIERVTAIMRRIESELQPGSDPRPSSFARTASSSGAIELVAKRSQRPGSSSVASEMPPFVAGPSLAPASRSWTMIAVAVAFTAALLVVGLRSIARHAQPPSPSDALPERAAAATTSAPAKIAEPAATAVSATPPASADLVAPVDAGQRRAPEPEAVHANAVSRPPTRGAYTAPPRAVRPAPPAPTTRAEPASPPSTGAGHRAAACESPFAIGADGIRQIKPECL